MTATTGHYARGIWYMLTAVAFFSVLDVLLKKLSVHYPAVQVGAMRGAASIPFVLAPLIARGRLRALLVKRWELHLVRGVIAVLMMVGFIYAVHGASLSDTYTLFMVAPLLITALSVLILKERVAPGSWIAVAVGLLGAICVLRPSGRGLSQLTAVAVLVSAGCYALSYVMARFMTRTETPDSMVFWLLIAMAAGCGVLAAPGWQPILRSDWTLVLGIGMTGAVGQHFITRAFVLAPASVIAPFDYTALVWGALWDRLLWGTTAPVSTILGAALIVGAGLYILLRTRRQEMTTVESVPTPLPADPPI
ncbi:MAG TPA: DMT family transporter [Steroidobacteraceae bacterium]